MSVYNEWMEAKTALNLAKQEELRLRNAICSTHLEEVIEGSQTTRFEGLKITATAKLNRTVDRELLSAIWDDLTDEERECIDYKPNLKLANYKRIEASGGLLLDAVTVKPGQSALAIVVEDIA